MTADSGPVVVRTASTPNEAKVFVALLQAEGIPAHVDSDWLVDEFIMSRRLMNMNAVKVFVPADAVERAREILQQAGVDEAELTAQALAAAPDPLAPPPPIVDGPRPRRTLPPWLPVVLGILAFVFLALWLGARERLGSGDPLYDQRWVDDHLEERFRPSGRLRSRSFDRDRDGHFEEWHFFDADELLAWTASDGDRDGSFEQRQSFAADGTLLSQGYDRDGDGFDEEWIEHRPGGLRAHYRDDDGDRRHETCTIVDAEGRELRRQRWDGARGWVDAAR
jgi:hypothetical protein